MLKEDEFAVLEFLKNNCGKEYKLFPLSKISRLEGDGFYLDDQKAETLLKNLDEKGYIEIKYFSCGEVLLKPLPLAFSVVKQLQKPQILQIPQQQTLSRKEKYTIFLLAFLGGFLGEIISVFIGVLLC